MIRSTILASVVWLAVASTAPAANTDFKISTFKDPNAAQLVFVDGRHALRMKSEGELPLSINLSASSVSWTPQNEVLWKDVSHMEATYKGEIGMIGGGSPRFVALLDQSGNGENDVTYDPNTDTWDMGGDGTIVSYWGSGVAPWQEPFSGGWETTGNVITDPAARWEGGQVGIPGHVTYDQTLDYAGDMQVLWLAICLDTGWYDGNEPDDLVQMLVSQVNVQGVRFGGGGPSGASFTEIMAIPEPASIVVMATGALGLLTGRQRRR